MPTSDTPTPLDTAERFHSHLDTCRQCSEHPFDLCPAGATLLAAVPIEGATVTAACLCAEIDPADRPCLVCDAQAYLEAR